MWENYPRSGNEIEEIVSGIYTGLRRVHKHHNGALVEDSGKPWITIHNTEWLAIDLAKPQICQRNLKYRTVKGESIFNYLHPVQSLRIFIEIKKYEATKKRRMYPASHQTLKDYEPYKGAEKHGPW